MIRGKTMFVCDDCHHRFIALDIEYMATAFSVPQKCPRCGSMHTMPGVVPRLKFLPKWWPSKGNIYRSIWESMDKAEKENN